MSQRTDRVDELLRQEIGAILAREVQDPRIGFATITDVETTPDLRHARVWVSVIGSDAERRETLEALGHAMGFVRRELGHRLRLRRIPEFHVRLDDSAERGTRVLRLLSELEAGAAPGEAPAGETLPTPVARIGPEDEHAAAGEEETASAEPPAGASRQARPRPVTRRGRGRRGRP